MSFTQDAFLGGRISARQPLDGYRAGADPVFLAAAVPARPGERVLELGCGSGIALLCLMARVKGLAVTGIERDDATAQRARENIDANGGRADVETADIASLPGHLTSVGFHHVMTNPPFFDRRRGSRAMHGGREAGRGEDLPLADWLDIAVRRLLPGGTLTLIQRAERLPECLCALDSRVGSTTVQPFVPRAGRSAKIMILQTKKGGRGVFQIASPIVLHEGDRHVFDGDSYTAAAHDVLRNGASLVIRN